MPEFNFLEQSFRELAADGLGITAFTANTAVTLAPSSGNVLEIYQIYFFNPDTTTDREAAIGGS